MEMDGWSDMDKMSRNKVLKVASYVLAAALLIFYIWVLYLAYHPNVTYDYRVRYIENGYFAR